MDTYSYKHAYATSVPRIYTYVYPNVYVRVFVFVVRNHRGSFVRTNIVSTYEYKRLVSTYSQRMLACTNMRHEHMLTFRASPYEPPR